MCLIQDGVIHRIKFPPRITFMIVVNPSPEELLLQITYRRQKCPTKCSL